MALFPGELINQRYRVLELLGEGERGATYRVWDITHEQEGVLKEVLDPEGTLKRPFAAESKRLISLNHPQLARFRDYFFLPQVGHYLLSDYVPGVSLQHLLKQYGPLPQPFVVDCIEAAADPLTYLHEKNQLHLNVKPANLRIRPDGQVVLVDSGLGGLNMPQRKGGYVSPEQQQGVDIDSMSDVYGLGATLYAALTHKEPPNSLERASGLYTLFPARQINSTVAPYLSLAANHAMSLNRETRTADVNSLARALRRPDSGSFAGASLAKEKDDIPQRNKQLPERTTPIPQFEPRRRRRQIQTRTIWGLAMVFVLLVVTIYSFTLLNQEELVGGSEVAATATTQSQVIAALTAVAPTATPTALPTLRPTPTPAPIISQTGMRMLFMPTGIFRYGNDDGENDEIPSNLINLEPYFIDETEVTNGQYRECVLDEACDPPARPNASYHDAYYNSDLYDDYPVIFVNWFQADNFCAWRGGRLPTEAEWERAAGYDPASLQRTLYPWGDEFAGNNLNYCDGNCPRDGRDGEIDDGHQDTAPVGSYVSGNSYIGASDMLGNVMEWTADWYDRDYYNEAPRANPRGPAEGEFKVLRGGSWFSLPDELSVTRRGFFDPTVTRATLGFRCAMDMP